MNSIFGQNGQSGILLVIGLAGLGAVACSTDDGDGGTTDGALTTPSPSGTLTTNSTASTPSSGATNPVVPTTTLPSPTPSQSSPVGPTATAGSPTTQGPTGTTQPQDTSGPTGTQAGPGPTSGPTGGAGGTGGSPVDNGMGGGGGEGTGAGGSGGTVTDGAGGAGGESGGDGPSPGTCEKGQTMGSDVVIMGESFYAIAPQYIQNVIQDHARAAGSLGANDSYRNVAVSGQNMNYIANNEWSAATQGNTPIKLVIMDGGGIDCLTGSSCPSCKGTFEELLQKMADYGVEDVIYTRYPEPGNPPGSDSGLKSCLDGFQPDMQEVCEGSTAPKCHFVDLRPVWVNGDTNDGLHPTQSGGDHVGDLIWSYMEEACLGQ